MPEQVLYKAVAPCRIGGAFRRAGEVFPMPEFKETPPYLVRAEAVEAKAAGESAKEKPPKRAKAAGESADSAADSAPGPMPEDLPGVVRD